MEVDFLKEAEGKKQGKHKKQNTNTPTKLLKQFNGEPREQKRILFLLATMLFCFSFISDTQITQGSSIARELELLELLLSSSLPVNPDNVEAHGLGKGPALADGDNIAALNTEARRAVGREVLVPLLVPVELLDVVHVIPAHDDGTPHLGGGNDSGQDMTADRDVSGEGALLVNVGSLDGLTGGLEAEADVAVVATTLLLGLGGGGALGVQENGILLLESLLVLQDPKRKKQTKKENQSSIHNTHSVDLVSQCVRS